jgi:hypothetical protein
MYGLHHVCLSVSAGNWRNVEQTQLYLQVKLTVVALFTPMKAYGVGVTTDIHRSSTHPKPQYLMEDSSQLYSLSALERRKISGPH